MTAAITIIIWSLVFTILMTGRNLELAYFGLRKVRLWMIGKPDMSRKAQRKRAEKARKQ